MTSSTFEFSSQRLALIFANLKTVREVKRVLDDEGKTELKLFLKYMSDNLKDLVPEIQSWKNSEIIENFEKPSFTEIFNT